MKQIMRPISVLVASGIATLGLLAACGGDEPAKATSTAAPEPVAAAQAESYERSAHLQGQATTYGAPAEHQGTVSQNTTEADRRAEAASRAEADRLERHAKLEGQARTYGGAEACVGSPRPQ